MIRIITMLLILSGTIVTLKAKNTTSPNIIVIFTDDQGYQDMGCFNSPKINTPNLDKMATEGLLCTSFYVSSSVCTPSRASLLTGRYSVNNGVGGVIFPGGKGMSPDEVTIAEMLKTIGYKTACIGKWHLGDKVETLPLAQGFDEYYGIPYSNDMYIGGDQKFDDDVVFLEEYTMVKAKADQEFNLKYSKNRKKIKERGIKELCPLFEGNEIVEYPCNQATLTKRYFERAMSFIDKADSKPFFLYITPAMPHVPLFASDKFKGTSERGLYGDVLEEIDHYTGKLLEHLKKSGLDENTLVIYTSDNGPWLGYKDHGGSALPLRDGKFSNYEGGVRVPCVMRWPGTIKANQLSNEILSTIDFLPTIAHYTGAKLPQVKIDGINIANHIENVKKSTKRDVMMYTKGTNYFGIRKGDWKYLPYSGARKAKSDSLVPELFNLIDDISETTNLADKYPKKVKELQELMDKMME
ncbi:MAG: sulfatase [Bacteroidales bacterium]|nr:sulfatase [Bacteroidales bacterium]